MQSPRCGRPFANPAFVAIGAFLFLWSFNPFSSTVLYYYSTEALHFSEQFVGSLTSWHAVGLLTGSILYGVICRMIPLALADSRLDRCGHPGHHRLLGISRRDERRGHQPRGRRRVRASARSSNSIWPPGFVVRRPLERRLRLLMSLTNLGAALSQGIGGSIYEEMAERWGYVLAFQILVGVGALFTAGCWLLMPLLNQVPVASAKDGALHPDRIG